MLAVIHKHKNVYIDTSAYTTSGLELVAHLRQRPSQRHVRHQLPDDHPRGSTGGTARARPQSRRPERDLSSNAIAALSMTTQNPRVGTES